MSAKLRLTLWITLMLLLLTAMVLVFVLVINSNAITDDPAGRLVKVVLSNADDVEFDHGRFDWNDLEPYKRGVYCLFTSDEGEVLLGAMPEGIYPELPYEANIIRSFPAEGDVWYLYDCYVDMDVTGIWIRGVVSSTDRSGLMRTILVLTASLLPALLILTIGGSWLIAVMSFKPMEKIIAAADSISQGDDLTERINLRRGPSEMRRLAAAFDNMFERLEKSFNTERQFASDVSHELRTPITVIMAQCDRAKRKDNTREEFLSDLEIIRSQSVNMSEIVQDLLSLTRMEHGTDRYPMKSGNLSTFVLTVCDEFVADDSRGISFTKDIQQDIQGRYNPTLLSRVLKNLLQNAYQYGKEGGNILLSLRTEDNMAVISVKDDGIGISKENQEKIWHRFWQADPARNVSGSSGLGLAMVKEIAQFHGGSVQVESEEGRGSEFIVRLPL